MKVLLVNGSPHEKGCTYTALQEMIMQFEKEGIDTELMWLGNEPVAGCIACGSCFKTGRCFRNDAVNELLEKAQDTDGFVFGSPVHFAGASGAITSFLDRVFYASMKGSQLAYKPGAAVVSARRSGTTAAFDQLNKYFTKSHMPVVTSSYWNGVHGFTPDDVRQDLEGLQTMRMLASNMAWLIRSLFSESNLRTASSF